MKILHIAAHVGGGIGSSYIGLGTCGHEHKIILLEEPINLNSVAKVKAAGFEILITADVEKIAAEIEIADVVVFNWTHHPALTKFFYRYAADSHAQYFVVPCVRQLFS